jgi:RNA polymerase sigma factor (sigma-70 family)
MTEGMQKLGEIFAREKSRFLGFVRRRLLYLSDMDAEDILSEVTYSLLRRADVVGEIENLSAYIYRSLTNRITDHQRKSVPQMTAQDSEDPSESAEPLFPPDSRPRPDQSLQQSELRDRLFTAIGELGAEERAVWVATEIDGCTFRELAADWDEPIGTLLSRKSRATEKLRRMLSDYEHYK